MSKSVAVVTALIVTLITVAWSAQQKPQAPSFRPQAQAGAQAPAQSSSSSLHHVSGLSAGDVYAISIPNVLNYQGKLLDATGKAVPDTTYSVVFGLYSLVSGGTPFWTETQTIRTKAGFFSALLGSVTPIGSVPEAGKLYLGMKVGADPEMTPRVQVASAAYAYIARKADTANYAIASGGGDNAWVRGGDSVLYTIRQLGVARGGAGNSLYGTNSCTHTNLGSSSTTGTSGQNSDFITVSGGQSNTACSSFATVAGGQGNSAGDNYAVVGGGFLNLAGGGASTIAGGTTNNATGVAAAVGGGYGNLAGGAQATVGGGNSNIASGDWSSVGGGMYDTASGWNANVSGGTLNHARDSGTVVGGGESNTASGLLASVGGGGFNTASGWCSAVGGGYYNAAAKFSTVAGGAGDTASSQFATVGGGLHNTASGSGATVAGGIGCAASADYSFAAGSGIVPSSYAYSAAFNGQTATTSGQTRVGILSKASGTFTIDDPVDPQNKILNHYFVESPEMVNVYRGVAVLGSDGRVEVHLPAYFDALNKDPMVQLTGVGSSDVVFVAEEEAGNRFVIGGKPGMKVYWTATGARKDQSAQITEDLMPVEQPKTGALAGHMLDDDLLISTMAQLQAMGLGAKYQFHTAAARQRYEDMLKQLREAKQVKGRSNDK